MNKQKESQAPEELRKGMPSPEETAELLGKATKVSSWLSALKQSTRRRPFIGKSTDGRFAVVLRDYRIESLNADESLENVSESTMPPFALNRIVRTGVVVFPGVSCTVESMPPNALHFT